MRSTSETGRTKHVVVVTGAPGSGKTTLAGQLAASLALPMFSLDTVKEALHDALAEADPSRYLLRLAAENVLGRFVEASPGGAVLDVWLDPARDDRSRLRALLPAGGVLREVYCDVPADIALRRYVDRRRHPHHLPPDDETLLRIARSIDLMAAGALHSPTGLGPVCRVDTTRGVDIPKLLAWVTAGPSAAEYDDEPDPGGDQATHQLDRH